MNQVKQERLQNKAPKKSKGKRVQQAVAIMMLFMTLGSIVLGVVVNFL